MMWLPIGFFIGYLVLHGAVFVGRVVASRKRMGLPYKETYGLSWPAREIIKDYHSLPEEHKPYGNILHAVRALDVKHTASLADQHFSRWTGESRTQTWNCGCWRSHQCGFTEYKDLRAEIVSINRALQDRERVLEIAGVEDGLSEVQQITDRLRQERSLIEDTTKELSS